MTPSQAAAKAFRDCRLNDARARKTASFLAQQHLLGTGASRAEAASSMPEINGLLDSWFESRKSDPSFTPDLTAITVNSVASAPSEPLPPIVANEAPAVQETATATEEA
ncbi:MAG: hypothetical protein SFV81_05970 [Pirellulaceae bacterium]|nr:hypothetical protein [Pirellulaceae bacterium]